MLYKIKKLAAEVVIALLTLPVLVPFYMLVVNSFKNKAEAAEMNLKLPVHWNIINNYVELINTGNLLTGLKNSLILTIIPTVLIVLITSIAAFVIQRRKQKLSGVLFNLFIMGMILPSFIVPTVIIVRTLHIPSIMGVIFIFITGAIPVSIFLYVGYYKSIPRELDESAVIDGCGMSRLFYQIIFPLVKPVTATLVIITTLGLWNDFGTSIYLLSGEANQTLTLTMFYFFGPHQADWNLVFACIVVVTLPVVILYFSLQKYIVSGMTGGAVKG